MPLSIVRNDIAKVRADVLVNAANTGLARGGGVCGALFAGAGAAKMEAACRAIGHCDTGNAVVTDAFDLPARYVVHAVGPVWRGGSHGERKLLRAAYRSVFERVRELNARSVALPLISSGTYGYPVARSLGLAVEEARAFLSERPNARVTLVVYDRRSFAEGIRRFHEVAAYIDDAEEDYEDELVGSLNESEADELWGAEVRTAGPMPTGPTPVPPSQHPAGSSWESPASTGSARASRRPYASEALAQVPFASAEARGANNRGMSNHADLEDLLDNLDASFSQTILALIDERGLTDAEVYRRANLSRQLFAKLRRDDHYRPTKQTAVALACALGLSLDETRSLLERAGYALSHASKFDIIVEYHLAHGHHDVFELNEMLFAFDQPLVGSV